MAASTYANGSLSLTLAQAIAYLTRPLIVRHSATTIMKLQLALDANLTSHFAPSWVPSEPLRGSGRRCLTLSPNALPPRPIYSACKSAGVEWREWIGLLGGIEFDLFIDPGCISVRFGNWDTGKVSRFFTIWSEDHGKERQAASIPIAAPSPGKTLAQQLLENDEDDDEQLFVMIADEVREPAWLTPILTQFPNPPIPPRSKTSSPDSVCSSSSRHSRSSSSSSGSGVSLFSTGSSTSLSSTTTVFMSPADDQPKVQLSRREKARQARVFVDTSRTEVTNYDGGKTTVLTGGVMLGAARVGPTSKPIASKTSSTGFGWRSSRA